MQIRKPFAIMTTLICLFTISQVTIAANTNPEQKLIQKLSKINFGSSFQRVFAFEPNLFLIKSVRGDHISYLAVQRHHDPGQISYLKKRLDAYVTRSPASPRFSFENAKRNKSGCYSLRLHDEEAKPIEQNWCFGAKQAFALIYKGDQRPDAKALAQAEKLVAEQIR